MNKNILRAVKRELKAMFEAFCSSRNCCPKSKNRFMPCLKLFAKHVLELRTSNETALDYTPEAEPAECTLEGPAGLRSHEDDFVVYIGVLVDFCMMKKLLQRGPHKAKLQQTKDLLYRYTQTKFYSFVRIPEVTLLFRLVVGKVGIKAFVTNNPAFGSSHSRYERQIDWLLNFEIYD